MPIAVEVEMVDDNDGDDGDDSDDDGLTGGQWHDSVVARAALPYTCCTLSIFNARSVDAVESYECARCGNTHTQCGLRSACQSPAPQKCPCCARTFCEACDAFRNTPCAGCGADACEDCTAAFVGGTCAPCRE